MADLQAAQAALKQVCDALVKSRETQQSIRPDLPPLTNLRLLHELYDTIDAALAAAQPHLPAQREGKPE